MITPYVAVVQGVEDDATDAIFDALYHQAWLEDTVTHELLKRIWKRFAAPGIQIAPELVPGCGNITFEFYKAKVMPAFEKDQFDRIYRNSKSVSLLTYSLENLPTQPAGSVVCHLYPIISRGKMLMMQRIVSTSSRMRVLSGSRVTDEPTALRWNDHYSLPFSHHLMGRFVSGHELDSSSVARGVLQLYQQERGYHPVVLRVICSSGPGGGGQDPSLDTVDFFRDLQQFTPE